MKKVHNKCISNLDIEKKKAKKPKEKQKQKTKLCKSLRDVGGNEKDRQKGVDETKTVRVINQKRKIGRTKRLTNGLLKVHYTNQQRTIDAATVK